MEGNNYLQMQNYAWDIHVDKDLQKVPALLSWQHSRGDGPNPPDSN